MSNSKNVQINDGLNNTFGGGSMFEDSMVESAGKIRTRKGSTVVVSAIVHLVLIAVLILVPLLYTERIEGATLTSFLVVPPAPLAPAPPRAPVNVSPKPVAATPPPIDARALIEPLSIPKDIAVIVDPSPEAIVGYGIGVQNGRAGDPSAIAIRPNLIPIQGPVAGLPPVPPLPLPPPPLVTTKHPEPIRISGTVQAGSLLAHRNPDYPPLARVARVEGAVILSATIGEDGSIKELKIVSATSPLLTPGLIDTLKTWKYKPTLLNNDPVEVLTTITVNFSLSGK